MDSAAKPRLSVNSVLKFASAGNADPWFLEQLLQRTPQPGNPHFTPEQQLAKIADLVAGPKFPLLRYASVSGAWHAITALAAAGWIGAPQAAEFAATKLYGTERVAFNAAFKEGIQRARCAALLAVKHAFAEAAAAATAAAAAAHCNGDTVSCIGCAAASYFALPLELILQKAGLA